MTTFSRNLVVRVTKLSKRLGGRLVLDNVSLDLFDGERVALTGTNGAGKTTLLRCLAGSIRPDAGQIRWFSGQHDTRRMLNRRIGMVGHESRLYPHLTARENLIFAARICSVGNAARCAEGWLKSTGLADFGHRFPSTLSRGMRQRLAIARALVHDPQLVLLDEPFGGLDSGGAEWLCELIEDLSARGRTILFATHDKSHVDVLATRVLVLHAGQLRRTGVCDQGQRQRIENPVAGSAASIRAA